MKDIHEVLRRKQAQYAELGKQIEALQGAAETFKAVAPLLEDSSSDYEASAQPAARAAAASASAAPAAAAPKPAAPARTTVPRWP